MTTATATRCANDVESDLADPFAGIGYLCVAPQSLQTGVPAHPVISPVAFIVTAGGRSS